MGGACHLVPVFGMQLPDIGDGWHRVPGYAEAPLRLVSGDVVCDQPEERRQRPGLAAGSRTGQLSNCERRRPREVSTLLPRVHLVVSLLKRWLAGTHQGGVSQEHLPYYLDEFTFRFNRRKSKSRGKLFFRLVQQAAETGPTTYAHIANASAVPRTK